MGDVFVGGLIALAVVFGLLIWIGFRNGDRDDDARASITTFERAHPEGGQLWARIAITNRSPTPLMVSCRYEALPYIGWYSRVAPRVSTMMPRWMGAPTSFSLLGAVDSAATHSWEVPLETNSDARAIRIVVRLDESARRTRVQRLDLALAGPAAH